MEIVVSYAVMQHSSETAGKGESHGALAGLENPWKGSGSQSQTGIQDRRLDDSDRNGRV